MPADDPTSGTPAAMPPAASAVVPPASAEPSASPSATADAAAASPPAAAAPITEQPAAVEPPVEGATETPPAGDEKPAEPALKPHTESEPGLLGQEKPADKPADGEPSKPAGEGDKPPGEAAPAADAPIVYEALTLPEGVKLDQARVDQADTVLREIGIRDSGARQRLYDLYMSEIKEHADKTLQSWHDTFAGMKRGWMDSARADEEIGGSAMQTSINASDRMIQLFTDDKSRKPFLDMLSGSGLDGHPEMIRFLTRIARKFDEPAVPPLPRNASPDRGVRPAGGNARPSNFYDNPRSVEVAKPR